MHACGHDGHMGHSAAGRRQYLARQRNSAASLHLIFQPAEERGGFDSGGKATGRWLFERPATRCTPCTNHSGVPQGRFLLVQRWRAF